MQIDRNGKITIDAENAKHAICNLLAAIHYLRKSAGLPLGSCKNTPSSPADTAEFCILNAAEKLGLDMGGKMPGQIDVTEFH